MSKLLRKVLKIQTSEFIYNMIEFMKKETENGGCVRLEKSPWKSIRFNESLLRTLMMIKFEINSEAKREQDENELPLKLQRKREKLVIGLDYFDVGYNENH